MDYSFSVALFSIDIQILRIIFFVKPNRFFMLFTRRAFNQNRILQMLQTTADKKNLRPSVTSILSITETAN